MTVRPVIIFWSFYILLPLLLGLGLVSMPNFPIMECSPKRLLRVVISFFVCFVSSPAPLVVSHDLK
jgi:hypothetical protein